MLSHKKPGFHPPFRKYNFGKTTEDGSNWPRSRFRVKSLSTNTQVSKYRKAFANGTSINTKLWKAQLHRKGQSGGFLGRIIWPLLKTEFALIGNVHKPLAKSILIPLGLTAVEAGTNAAIHKKMFGSGATSLIHSNEWYHKKK